MKSMSRRTLLAVAMSAVVFGTGTAAAAGNARPQLGVNKPPVASFTDSVNWLTVSFTDTSTDSDGTIASHAWNFGDGSTSTAANPVHAYAAAATYNVTETVKDNKGASGSRTIAVTALANPDKPPVANFTYNSKFVSMQGWVTTFTDTSTDADGTIAAHAWNFGDGGTSTAANPVHTFVPGNFNVVETVTDNGGATASKTQFLSFSTVEPVFELSNTGFETTSSWTASTGVICAAGCSGESAHAGVGFAWMGGYGAVHTDTLSQSTPGPIIQGSSIPLQFYLHIDTAETSTTTAYDKLTVALYDKNGVLLKTLATFSNLNKNTGYAVHSYDMRPYIGQQVTVKFTATEDSSQQTSFVLDDVTMVNYY